jgi:hypothetical protein
VFFGNQREQLVGLTARYAMLTVFHLREFATAGGLMSYGPSLFETYRQAGIYTGKILNGPSRRIYGSYGRRKSTW